ncbi:MAG: hypothetical protein ACK5KU_08365 [Beutenbergiaceae bacterium]
MTGIYLDREGMEYRLEKLLAVVDSADEAIGELPDAPDGGIATSTIAFMVSVAAEAAGLFADTTRALGVISLDVVADISNTDAAVAEEFRRMEEELGDR